ncbi:MAG TPA: PqqD family protein [bacterium]|nr:PqqD family protein [bacterium]
MAEVYRVSPRISSETINGEVMILDLDTGNYYNLAESGAAIWEFLEAGASAAEIVEGLSSRFEAEPHRIAASVERLLGEFKDDRIISAVAAGERSPKPPTAATRRPFVEPVLNKFSDLKDLLMIDPIHEVDQVGWPQKA